jgi:hypothetical protein
MQRPPHVTARQGCVGVARPLMCLLSVQRDNGIERGIVLFNVCQVRV